MIASRPAALRRSSRGRLTAGLLALGVTAATAAPPMYAITLVDTLPGHTDNCYPSGINDSGQIVGSCSEQAYVWTPGVGIRELVAGPGLLTTAEAINSAGKVTGRASRDFETQAYFWDPAVGFQLLGGMDPERPYSEPYAINDADQIVGDSVSAAPETLQRPFVWTAAEGMQWLAQSRRVTGVAHDINNQGVSAGYHSGIPNAAFRIDAEGVPSRLLPPRPNQGAGVYAMNDSGQVVGFVDAFFSSVNRAALWSPSNELFVIDRRPLGSGYSYARDINNAGQVVGFWAGTAPTSVFYWDTTARMRDLQALLDPADPLTPEVNIFLHPPRINNAGQIAVSARVAGNIRTLLLTPLAAR